LLKLGAKKKVNDPKTIVEAQEHYLKKIQNITSTDSKCAVLKDADALFLFTDWKEFRSPDFEEIKIQLKTPVTF
jgi:UDPglucose 6-dehydrogenase